MPLSVPVPTGALNALIRAAAPLLVALGSPLRYTAADGLAVVGRFATDRPLRLALAAFVANAPDPSIQSPSVTTAWTAGVRVVKSDGSVVELGSVQLDYPNLAPGKPVSLALADASIPAGSVVEALVQGQGAALDAPSFTLTFAPSE